MIGKTFSLHYDDSMDNKDELLNLLKNSNFKANFRINKMEGNKITDATLISIDGFPIYNIQDGIDVINNYVIPQSGIKDKQYEVVYMDNKYFIYNNETTYYYAGFVNNMPHWVPYYDEGDPFSDTKQAEIEIKHLIAYYTGVLSTDLQEPIYNKNDFIVKLLPVKAKLWGIYNKKIKEWFHSWESKDADILIHWDKPEIAKSFLYKLNAERCVEKLKGMLKI